MRIIVFLVEHLVSHLDSMLLTDIYIYIYKAIVFYSQTKPNLSMHPAAVTVIVWGQGLFKSFSFLQKNVSCYCVVSLWLLYSVHARCPSAANGISESESDGEGDLIHVG